MANKLWGKDIDKKVFEFTVGNDPYCDTILLPYDIKGSEAHAKMLKKIKILDKKELDSILKALKQLKTDYDKGKVKVALDDEDMHTVIENYLVKKLGKIGKKIHTGRSRNDQVLTALRLYYNDKMKELTDTVMELINQLQIFDKKYGKIEIPGYTHMRKAMPSSIHMWAGAFIEALEDDNLLLKFVQDFAHQSPLGTAAGYGAPVKVDREMTAKFLKFTTVQNNPVYVQNSRGKFEALILNSLSQVMFEINKMSSDLILFSMTELGFFDLPSKFCTGSSIMPQKKNPDVLELMRGNYHVVLGEEFKIKSIIGNLTSGFNRDMQLTKESMIKSFNVTIDSFQVMSLIVKRLKVNKEKAKEAMTSDLYATKKTYELVAKGMSFRDAYHQVKKDLKH